MFGWWDLSIYGCCFFLVRGCCCWWSVSCRRCICCWFFVGRLWRIGRGILFRRSCCVFFFWCFRLFIIWMLGRWRVWSCVWSSCSSVFRLFLCCMMMRFCLVILLIFFIGCLRSICVCLFIWWLWCILCRLVIWRRCRSIWIRFLCSWRSLRCWIVVLFCYFFKWFCWSILLCVVLLWVIRLWCCRRFFRFVSCVSSFFGFFLIM